MEAAEKYREEEKNRVPSDGYNKLDDARRQAEGKSITLILSEFIEKYETIVLISFRDSN